MKVFKKILLIIFVLFLNINVVNALTVDKNELTLAPGKNKVIGLYANVNEEVTSVKFSLVFSSYDVTATFTPVATYDYSVPRSTNHLITFPTAETGNVKLGDITINVSSEPKVVIGSINIHSVTATTASGKTIKLNSQNVTVNISESADDDKEQIQQTQAKPVNNLLSKVESNIVKINIVDNVYNYDVEVPNDVTELDLKAIPKDKSYKVDISSQKISEIKDNSIKIVVTTNEGLKEDYLFKLKIVENDKSSVEQIDIDNTTFDGSGSYKIKWIGMILVLGLVLVIGVFICKRKNK